jgi:hypothetical protein
MVLKEQLITIKILNQTNSLEFYENMDVTIVKRDKKIFEAN